LEEARIWPLPAVNTHYHFSKNSISLTGKIIQFGLKINRRTKLKEWKREEISTEVKSEEKFRNYRRSVIV